MTDASYEDANYLSKRVIGGKIIDTRNWPTPDEGALQGAARSYYMDRKRAVSLFMAGEADENIKKLTSIGSKQVYRLIRERCLEIHPDGLPYGWRALVRYVRINPYTRKKKIVVDQFGGGAAGAFQMLFEKYPDLKVTLDKKILGIQNTKKLIEIKQSKIRISNWFLDQLRELGLEARQEWPFNTISRGYFTINRYVINLLAKNPKALALAIGGPDLVKKLKSGDGSKRPAFKFMQRVEMDAHKLDGRFCVCIPLLDGGTKEKIVHRLWVIVLLEVVSRAVIGYYFSMRKEVSSEDVLRGIKCALRRWQSKTLSFSDIAYLPGSGLMSVLSPKFVGLCWDETSVDGALAETCKTVVKNLNDVVGSTIIEPNSSFAIRRSKDDRPFIETYFRNLAGKGFQRLSNTTGGKVQDKNGRDPDEIALTSRFQYEYAVELLDVLIANYNMTSHRGISGRKPLEYAHFLMENSGTEFRYVEARAVESFFSNRKQCVVRGGAESGRRPFVEYEYARYTNEILQNRQDLVGKKIWVINHKEDDARVASASTVEGTSLGVLRAAPPWNMSPHSISVRKAVCQAAAKDKFILPAGGDGVEIFINFVESNANNKLPVHPAYLEARRILTEAAEQSIGISMLASAKERAKSSSNETPSSLKNKSSEAGGKDNPATEQKKSSIQLPVRRMASAR